MTARLGGGRRTSPPAGGDQSTWTTGTPPAARSSANPSSPTLITASGERNSPLTVMRSLSMRS